MVSDRGKASIYTAVITGVWWDHTRQIDCMVGRAQEPGPHTELTRKNNMRYLCGAVILMLAGVLGASAPNHQRSQQRTVLQEIRTIAVVPPFFGVPNSALPKGKNLAETIALQTAYRSTLRTLKKEAINRLPQRITSRLNLKVMPTQQVVSLLSAHHVIGRDLFSNHGDIIHGGYPKLNLAACAHLCAMLHVNAVLVTDLDGPQRIGGHYVFVPLQGSGYEPSHVVSKAQFDVVDGNGLLILYADETVQHPATRIGAQQFVFADWLEAQNLLIENFMDYWNLKKN